MSVFPAIMNATSHTGPVCKDERRFGDVIVCVFLFLFFFAADFQRGEREGKSKRESSLCVREGNE